MGGVSSTQITQLETCLAFLAIKCVAELHNLQTWLDFHVERTCVHCLASSITFWMELQGGGGALIKPSLQFGISLNNDLLESKVFSQHDSFLYRLHFHFQCSQGQFELFAHYSHDLVSLISDKYSNSTIVELFKHRSFHVYLVPFMAGWASTSFIQGDFLA